jgi:hypothetical protein
VKRFILGCLLFSQLVQAYVPSPEGLLRNNSNPDIENTVISAQFEVSVKPNDASTVENKLAFKKGEFQRMYFLSKGRITKIYQSYTDQNGGKSRHFLNAGTEGYAKLQDRHFDGIIFWSTLDSLLVNTGRPMIASLNRKGDELPLNSNLINQEKLVLLNRYREYVELIKKDRALEKSLENPFHVEELDKRQKNAEIQKQPFLNETQFVSIEMLNGQLVWKIKSKIAEMLFNYDTRQMMSMTILGDGNIQMTMGEYVLMNGTHLFPDKISVKKGQEEYSVKIKSLKHFNESSDSFDQRFQKAQKDDKAKQATVFTSFLF